MAQKHLPPEQVNAWVSRQTNQQQSMQEYEKNLEATTDPFARMHARQARLDRFMDLFAGRQDVFARQWADKDQKKSGYVPVRRPMDKGDLEDHLKGVKTYGIYLMDQNAMVRCGIIDADLVPSLRGKNRKTSDSARIKKEQAYMIARLDESSRAIGLAPLVEISGGKGFHFWYFSDKPVQASVMRKAMAGLADPFRHDPEYNPHMVDYKLSRLRGTPLGCRRIHALTGIVRDFCDIAPDNTGYIHPLLLVEAWQKMAEKKCRFQKKIMNLEHAIDNLKTAISQVERFMA